MDREEKKEALVIGKKESAQANLPASLLRAVPTSAVRGSLPVSVSTSPIATKSSPEKTITAPRKVALLQTCLFSSDCASSGATMLPSAVVPEKHTSTKGAHSAAAAAAAAAAVAPGPPAASEESECGFTLVELPPPPPTAGEPEEARAAAAAAAVAAAACEPEAVAAAAAAAFAEMSVRANSVHSECTLVMMSSPEPTAIMLA